MTQQSQVTGRNDEEIGFIDLEHGTFLVRSYGFIFVRDGLETIEVRPRLLLTWPSVCSITGTAIVLACVLWAMISVIPHPHVTSRSSLAFSVALVGVPYSGYLIVLLYFLVAGEDRFSVLTIGVDSVHLPQLDKPIRKSRIREVVSIHGRWKSGRHSNRTWSLTQVCLGVLAEDGETRLVPCFGFKGEAAFSTRRFSQRLADAIGCDFRFVRLRGTVIIPSFPCSRRCRALMRARPAAGGAVA